MREEDYFYKKTEQEKYAKNPWAEREDVYDITPKEFSNLMMENFKTSGILDLMKKEKVSVLASSASTGKKDWEFFKQLDGHLGKLKKFHRPSVVLTDFALEGEEKKPIIKKPEQEYKNLDTQVVACDSGHLPFRENEFQVLYERLGALYHIANEDIKENVDGELVQNMLEEYKRVVKPGGKIIFDWGSRKSKHSSAKKIHEAAKENVGNFFENMGFEMEVVGKEERSVILTNPD